VGGGLLGIALANGNLSAALFLKQGVHIQPLLSQLVVDVHAPVENKQNKNRVPSHGVVDVVTFLKDQAADTSIFMVNMAQQRIGLQIIDDETVDLVLELVRVVL